VLKDNDARLVTYVPDHVLTPLLSGVTSDNCFRSVCTTREDEAIIESTVVMAGLVPAIHALLPDQGRRGCPAQGRA